MKKTTLLIALTAAASGQVFANTSKQIELEGFVPSMCSITGEITKNGGTATIESNKLTFANFVTAQGQLNSQTVSVQIPDVTCNGKATIQLASSNGALVNNSVQDSPYASRKAHYGVTAEWAGQGWALSAEGVPIESEVTGGTQNAQSGPVAIDISIDGNGRMQAGYYRDTLTITIVPQ